MVLSFWCFQWYFHQRDFFILKFSISFRRIAAVIQKNLHVYKSVEVARITQALSPLQYQNPEFCTTIRSILMKWVFVNGALLFAVFYVQGKQDWQLFVLQIFAAKFLPLRSDHADPSPDHAAMPTTRWHCGLTGERGGDAVQSQRAQHHFIGRCQMGEERSLLLPQRPQQTRALAANAEQLRPWEAADVRPAGHGAGGAQARVGGVVWGDAAGGVHANPAEDDWSGQLDQRTWSRLLPNKNKQSLPSSDGKNGQCGHWEHWKGGSKT